MGINDGPCSVDGCDRDAEVRGWCGAHYARVIHDGDVRADVPIQGSARERGCSVDGCDNDIHYAHGYCQAHYERVRRHGDPQADVPIRRVR